MDVTPELDGKNKQNDEEESVFDMLKGMLPLIIGILVFTVVVAFALRYLDYRLRLFF